MSPYGRCISWANTHGSSLYFLNQPSWCAPQVAVKFEHKTSKGCSSAGTPYEWTMYRELRDCYGVPKLHHRGVHGDFYVMVSPALLVAARRDCRNEGRAASFAGQGSGMVGNRAEAEHEEQHRRAHNRQGMKTYALTPVSRGVATTRDMSVSARSQVMDLLGPSLWDRWNREGQRMPEHLVACIAVEALTILEHLHTKGCARKKAGLHAAMVTQARPEQSLSTDDIAGSMQSAWYPWMLSAHQAGKWSASPCDWCRSLASLGGFVTSLRRLPCAGSCTATSSRRTSSWAPPARPTPTASTSSTWAWVSFSSQAAADRRSCGHKATKQPRREAARLYPSATPRPLGACQRDC